MALSSSSYQQLSSPSLHLNIATEESLLPRLFLFTPKLGLPQNIRRPPKYKPAKNGSKNPLASTKQVASIIFGLFGTWAMEEVTPTEGSGCLVDSVPTEQ